MNHYNEHGDIIFQSFETFVNSLFGKNSFWRNFWWHELSMISNANTILIQSILIWWNIYQAAGLPFSWNIEKCKKFTNTASFEIKARFTAWVQSTGNQTILRKQFFHVAYSSKLILLMKTWKMLSCQKYLERYDGENFPE